MHIERLQIEGFGHYADTAIEDFDTSLTIVRGQNEAGKSTLLAFMRAVLFGFPTRLGAQHYPPLNGGRHGGRIDLRLHDGRRFAVERLQGRGRGAFKAWGEDGGVIDEATFNALIGHASETLFRSAFTFDLNDLPRFNDADGDLAGLLYGASMGAEQLPHAVKDFDDRIDNLFLPSGSNQKIARLLRDMEEARAHIREVTGQAAEYRDLTKRQDQIAGELEDVQRSLAQQASQLQESNLHASAWKDWTQLRVLDQRLAGLKDTSAFPADGLNRLERVEEDLRKSTAALEEAESELADARRDAAMVIPDTKLLKSAGEIEGLRRARSAVDGSLRDLPERRAELEAREGELQRLLKKLGPTWDEKRLFSFDLSIPRQAEIERWQRRFEDLRTDQQGRDRDREAASWQSESAKEAQQDAVEERTKFDDVPDEDAVRRRSAGLRSLRALYDRYERNRQRLADMEAQHAAQKASPPLSATSSSRVTPRVAALVLGTVLAIGAGAALVLDEPTVAAVVGAIGAFVFVAAWFLASGSQEVPATESSIPQQFMDDVRKEFASAEEVLRRGATGIIKGVDEQNGALPNEDALSEAGEELDQAWLRTRERSQADAKVIESSRAAEQAKRRLDDAEKAMETALNASTLAGQEWNRWLQAGDLPADLAPQTAGRLIAAVEVARAKAEDLLQWRQRIKAISNDIQEYRRRVEPVAKTLKIDLTDAERAAVEVADAIIERFETAREDQAKRDQASVTVRERQSAQERAKKNVTAAEKELSGLLKSAKAKTADEFHKQAAIHEQRADLKKQRDDGEMRLRQLIGPETDALEALDQTLSETTIEQIEGTVSEVQDEIEEGQTLRDELLDHRGRVTAELKQLHDDEAASEARSQAASLTAEIEASARKWASLVVARALLQHTRERYERERQPAVIKKASEFFSILTEGRYSRLYRPLGESTVTVEDSNGVMKGPEHLSRGTKEQLYLALRLGAIGEAMANNERLPVIVDEVLVNFDPVRARRAAEAFVKLAEQTQVMVFTCHPWIADLFEEVAGKHRVISLD